MKIKEQINEIVGMEIKQISYFFGKRWILCDKKGIRTG